MDTTQLIEDDDPDDSTPCALLVGDISIGYKMHGPFGTEREAVSWYFKHPNVGNEYHVMYFEHVPRPDWKIIPNPPRKKVKPYSGVPQKENF